MIRYMTSSGARPGERAAPSVISADLAGKPCYGAREIEGARPARALAWPERARCRLLEGCPRRKSRTGAGLRQKARPPGGAAADPGALRSARTSHLHRKPVFRIGKNRTVASATGCRSLTAREVVVITTRSFAWASGTHRHGRNRDRLVRRLKRADRTAGSGSLPVVTAADGSEQEVIIHSKVVAIDDSFFASARRTSTTARQASTPNATSP